MQEINNAKSQWLKERASILPPMLKIIKTQIQEAKKLLTRFNNAGTTASQKLGSGTTEDEEPPAKMPRI